MRQFEGAKDEGFNRQINRRNDQKLATMVGAIYFGIGVNNRRQATISF